MPKIIHSTGPCPCDYALIAERPGKVESRIGRVLCGPSGQETDRYLLNNAGIDRASIFCSNVVRDWRDDEPPSPEEIQRDRPELERELKAVQPKYIMAMGLYAARWFLGDDIEMEVHNGLCFPDVEICSQCGKVHRESTEPSKTPTQRVLGVDRIPSGAEEESAPTDGDKGLRSTPASSPVCFPNRANTGRETITSHLRERPLREPVAFGATDVRGTQSKALETGLHQRTSTGRELQADGEETKLGMSSLSAGSDYTTSKTCQRCGGATRLISVMPVYHAAAGLHQPAIAAKVAYGFTEFGRMCKGEPMPRGHLTDLWADRTEYSECKRRDNIIDYISGVDTEGSVERPWCLSWSATAGHGRVLRNRQIQFNGTVVFHNAIADLPVLEAMGVTIAKWEDTMVKAAMLGVLPYGLKPLCRRLVGMQMQDYDDLVRDARREKAFEYLSRVIDYATANPTEAR